MEDKNKDPVVKLEADFFAFQKQWEQQWKKFLENDFTHLVDDVKLLVKQNKNIQKNVGVMEKRILDALGARAYNWVPKENPQ